MEISKMVNSNRFHCFNANLYRFSSFQSILCLLSQYEKIAIYLGYAVISLQYFDNLQASFDICLKFSSTKTFPDINLTVQEVSGPFSSDTAHYMCTDEYV